MIMTTASLGREDSGVIEKATEPQDQRRVDRDRQLVLLVDDDPHDREIYGRILCYNGFDVVCADSGQAGINIARRALPDVVLLDIGLPDLHGLDLCSSLRTDPETSGIPVIALSAYSETRMGEQARLAGCTRYIEKPASPVGVLHEVEQLVGKAPLPGDGRPPYLTAPGSDPYGADA